MEFSLVKQISETPGRSRHWLADSVLGAAIALVAITVAQAALPDRDPPRPQLRPALQPAAPVEAPVLIAFQHPLPGYDVGSPFGLRRLPWEQHGRLHAGVDIAAPARAPVLAAADGVVTRIGNDAGYGRFVEVKHAEGLTTLYGHLGAYAPGLKSGQAVKAGMKVGLIGSTGVSTGDHLHFEIHDRRGRPMDPEMFLGRSFATLDEMPIKQALRTPRGVRVAYVSRIPASKQAIMKAKDEPAGEVSTPLDGAVQMAAAKDSAGAEPVRKDRPRAQIQL